MGNNLVEAKILLESAYEVYLESHGHPNLRKVTLHNITLSLLYPKTLSNGCVQFESLSLLSQFPLIYHIFWY